VVCLRQRATSRDTLPVVGGLPVAMGDDDLGATGALVLPDVEDRYHGRRVSP
jgi:hypothetical protein